MITKLRKDFNNQYSNHAVNLINDNYFRVLENIEQTAQSVNRKTTDISLVVVTKAHPMELLLAALSAGARKLGENYVEEAIPKILEIGDMDDLEWHMIGHVQSRKSHPVSEHFHWVHSIDSLKLARRLNQHALEADRRLSILLECNVSGEESKFGWRAWDESQWDHLAEEIRPIMELEYLNLKGLMTIPPLYGDPELSRPYFRCLYRLRNYLSFRFPQTDLQDLSMGMSSDYTIAIEEGATIIRVGTAILGERKKLISG